jgi:hypothetical protein
MIGITNEKVDGEPRSSLDLILTMIFAKALPLWERYNGAVPEYELRKLEERGDWPRGLAAAAIARLSRDKELREQLRNFLERESVEFETRKGSKGHK